MAAAVIGHNVCFRQSVTGFCGTGRRHRQQTVAAVTFPRQALFPAFRRGAVADDRGESGVPPEVDPPGG